MGIQDDNGKKHKVTIVKEYNRKKIILSVVELIFSLLYMMLIVLSGLSAAVADIALGITARPYFTFLIFIALVGAIELFLLFPIALYQGYFLEHRYGLSNQSLGRWFWEECKGALVGVVLFTPVLLLFYFFLRNFQQLWWLPVACALFIFGVLLARLGPVLIFPLFYTFEPINDEPLIRRLKELAGPISISGVFRFNLSKNTKKANAAFAGLGKTKRILIGDTLLDNFSSDEIVSVFSHEIGHYKNGHIWKGIVSGFFISFVGLFLTAVIYERSLVLFNLSRIDQLAALPILGLILTVYGIIVMPIQNGLSRHFERQADAAVFAKRSNVAPFISSMERLAEMNMSDKNPHPLIEFWCYSHPSVGKRIETAKRYISE